MGTLIVNFVGANAYVPHQDGSKLLVVMPNASKLGKSPQQVAADGTPLSAHMPCLWEEKQEGRVWSIRGLRKFLGARLEVIPEGTPDDFDLSAVQEPFRSSWLDIDPALLKPQPDPRLGAQVVLSHGTIERYLPPDYGTCTKEWEDPTVRLSTTPILTGLKATLRGVDKVTLRAEPWIDAKPAQLYVETLDEDDEVTLFIGNQCAEHLLAWPRHNNRPARGGSRLQKTVDSDFRWLYQLAKNPEALKPFPAPLVDGSPIEEDSEVPDAFDTAWGGGGAAACECNGCTGGPGSF